MTIGIYLPGADLCVGVPLLPLPGTGKGTQGFAILGADTSASSPLSSCKKAAEPPGFAAQPLTPFECFHFKESRISQCSHNGEFSLVCSFDVAFAGGNL